MTVALSKLAPAACVAALLACLWVQGTREVQLSHFGDDQEYLTMTTSFARHLSPEFRAGDEEATLRALPISWQRSLVKKFTPGPAPGAYYPSRSGEYYAFHFFTYSAAVAPVRAILEGHPDAFRSHQYFNLIALSAALASLLAVLRPKRQAEGRAPPGAAVSHAQSRVFWTLLSLAFLTPVLWFTTYANTETFVFSLGLAAAACRLSDRPVLAIFLTSVAATQYQPLALLALFLCGEWLWVGRHALRAQRMRVAAALASTALVFVPSAFYYLHFGVPNLIAREGLASVRYTSFRKFVGLFIDLNSGLLVYAPGVLLMLALATGWAISRARRRNYSGLGLLAAIALTMAASTVQRNWNHPTFGISRYALYAIAPALMFIGGELRERAVDWRFLAASCALALGLQVAVHRANGLLAYRGTDAAHHTPIARYVLERWPALYSPHSEIFCERTSNRCWPDAETGETSAEFLPIAYLDESWTVHKLLAPCEEAKVLAIGPWTKAQRERIHEALQRCTGKRPVYVNFDR